MNRLGMWDTHPVGLWRVATARGVAWARGPAETGPRELLDDHSSLDALLTRPAEALRAALHEARTTKLPLDARALAPLQNQQVWAAGVTFERSRSARNEETADGGHYDSVYLAERPELFYKAAPGHSRGPDAPVGIRADSGWNVPEPELGLVVNSRAEIAGYTVGNDMSSRAIEGENPLYLPQAKVYRGSCAVGPCVVPVGDAPALPDLEIKLSVERAGWVEYFDTVALAAMRRKPGELVDWLFRGLDFDHGVVLLTGTSIVPPADFTLAAGDVVSIGIEGVGALRNPVEVVDTTAGIPTLGPRHARPTTHVEEAP